MSFGLYHFRREGIANGDVGVSPAFGSPSQVGLLVATQRTQARRPRHENRRGYVLVMVLMLIVLAGMALVGAARRTMAAGAAAREAQQELQRRWGAVSVQRCALGRAEKMLADAEVRVGAPLTETRAVVDLGGLRFGIAVADEGAKLPASVLVAEVGRERAERAIRELVRRKGLLNEVRLEPLTLPAPKGEKRRPPSLQSLSQVFPTATAEDWLTLGRWISPWAGELLSVRRAPAEVVAARCGTLLSGSQIAALKSLLAADPKLKVDDAIVLLALTEESLEKIDGKLGDLSGCYSVWVITSDGRRRWYRFAVAREEGASPIVFEW